MDAQTVIASASARMEFFQNLHLQLVRFQHYRLAADAEGTACDLFRVIQAKVRQDAVVPLWRGLLAAVPSGFR